MTLEAGVDGYAELGATASDDGNPSVEVVIGGDIVDPNKVGTYVVTYDATDGINAATQKTRTVNVVDRIAPVITLNGDAIVTLEAGVDAYAELGATAADIADGDLTGSIVIDASAVNTAAVGSYTVTYNVSDTEGNAADTVTRTVDVVDTTPPVIVVPTVPGLEFFADSVSGRTVDYFAIAEDDAGNPINVSVSDNADPDPTLVCTPAAGLQFPPGKTIVICDATTVTAAEQEDNTASASFDISVLFKDGGGILFSKGGIKAGSVVPLRWEWKDLSGNNVLIDFDKQTFTVSICGGEPVFFLSPGSSGFRLNADLGWEVNWQTVDQQTGENLDPGNYCASIELLVSPPQFQFSDPMTIRRSKK